MFRQKVLQIPDSQCLGKPAVRPQDISAACIEKYVFPDLEKRLRVVESEALVEVPEDIFQPELHQEVRKLLNSGVLDLPYFGINISHHNGYMVPEADQGLLQVREVLQGGRG